MSYEVQATFYRAALLLGLMQGGEVILWAEEIVRLDPESGRRSLADTMRVFRRMRRMVARQASLSMKNESSLR